MGKDCAHGPKGCVNSTQSSKHLSNSRARWAKRPFKSSIYPIIDETF